MARKPRAQAPALDPALAAAWQLALDAAVTVNHLEPWLHVDPEAVLGVRDPRSGEVDWCVVIGHGGEMFGAAVYLGHEGYASLHQLNHGEIDEFDQLVSQRAVSICFESAATCTPETKKLLKALGRQFRGAHAWPEILVHEPGMVPVPPWSEAQLLRITNALAGLAALVPWAGVDPEGGVSPVASRTWCIEPPFAGADPHQVELPPVSRHLPEPPPFDQLAATRLRAKEQGAAAWFVEWFTMGDVIDTGEVGSRPYFAAYLLVIDVESGLILGTEVSSVQETASRMQQLVVRLVVQHGRPASLLVRREDLAATLRPFAAALDVLLQHEPELIELTRQVHGSFGQFMGG